MIEEFFVLMKQNEPQTCPTYLPPPPTSSIPLQSFPHPLRRLPTVRLEPSKYDRGEQIVRPFEIEGTKDAMDRHEYDRPMHQRSSLFQCFPTFSQIYRHNHREQYTTDGDPRRIECRIHEFNDKTRHVFPSQIDHTTHDKEPSVDLH